jgi:hypothetical protein
MRKLGAQLVRFIVAAAIGLAQLPAFADQPGESIVPEASEVRVVAALPAPAGSSTLNVAELEKAYKAHSIMRNRIAEQIKWLWREERFLKEDYEYSGLKGDNITNSALARDLLAVRQQIDILRRELSRENRALQLIGEQIPD